MKRLTLAATAITLLTLLAAAQPRDTAKDEAAIKKVIDGLNESFQKRDAKERAEFDAFFDKVTKAEAELFRGRPESLKALWSRAPDVTLFGVSGGSGEHGWAQVGPRLDWTNTQYAEGTLTVERIASHVDGTLGYVVQRERVGFKVPGRTQESVLEIRATWIFRSERDGWRIIHRHADSQMKRQGPAERK